MHKTKKITIKTAEVDELIIPVVKWLNSFPGIYTRWSCQGDKADHDNKETEGPSITFYCEDEFDLLKVLRSLGDWSGRVTVKYYKGSLRYKLCFGTHKTLAFFIEIHKL